MENPNYGSRGRLVDPMSTRGRALGEVPSPQPSRRILTKPAEPAEGKPHDNVNSDLIVSVGDELRSQLGTM